MVFSVLENSEVNATGCSLKALTKPFPPFVRYNLTTKPSPDDSVTWCAFITINPETSAGFSRPERRSTTKILVVTKTHELDPYKRILSEVATSAVTCFGNGPSSDSNQSFLGCIRSNSDCRASRSTESAPTTIVTPPSSLLYFLF